MPQNIPPELMAMMQGGGAPGGAPGGMPGGAPGSPPVSSPMSTPQSNEGEKRDAMGKVQMALKILEQTLPIFGSDSEEGAAILAALKAVSKPFGEKREQHSELIPAELMNLLASIPKGMHGGAPGGMPGGMPGGAPGGAGGGMPPGGMPQQQPM